MQTKGTLSTLIDFIWPFKKWVFVMILMNTTWAIDVSFRPYLIKIILDQLPHIAPGQAVSSLVYPSIAYVAMSFLTVIFFRFYDYAWLRFNPDVKRHIGDILMKRMMKHSHQLLQNHFAGNLGNKIKDVMSFVPDLFRLFLNDFFGHTLALAIAVFTFWQVSPFFSTLLLIWFIMFFGGSLLLSPRAKRVSKASAEESSKIVGYIVDILSNMMSVRLFSASFFESTNLRKAMDKWIIANRIRDWHFLYMYTFQGFSFAIYHSLCFYFLITGFDKGTITAGDFAMVIMMNMSIINFLWTLSQDIGKFAELLGSISQGLNVAQYPLEIEDSPQALPLKITRGEITFDDVEFGYTGAEPLFQNKSVKISAGEKVGLVGFSGGGKSTFVNLILRLYDVTSGSILIDDQDVKNVTQDSLRAAIAMIPQDPSLFHRSLMENIRYGRPEASDEEVIEASRHAHAHEFIVQLANGYDSLVGERGVKLSGGQRQRIAIARAILKNAPILILDEATSQLDSVTESYIQEALWELMQDKTTIVIAHRLSTLLHMDRILVFDQGKIVEEGSHQDLLNRKNLYKTLWETQVGGFLAD